MKLFAQKFGYFVIGLTVLTSVVRADTRPLPDAEKVMAAARLGRVEFVKAIADLQTMAPGVQTADELYAYLKLLDPLSRIAEENQYQVDLLGGTPVNDLAKLLTENGVKFIRLDMENWELVELFFRWASDNTRFATAQAQGYFVFPLTEKEECLRWHAAIMKTLDLLRAVHAQGFALQAFEELQGATVKKLLAFKGDLSIQDATRLIAGTKSVAALTEVVSYVEQEVLTTKSPTFLKQALEWGFLMGENVRQIKQTVPMAARLAPGTIIIEVLTKLLNQEQAPAVQTVDAIVKNLLPSQVGELGGMLVQLYQEQLIPQPLTPFLFELTNRILKLYAEMGLTDKLRELGRIQQRLAMIQLNQE